MKIERLLVVLMAITVVLQAATLYRQQGNSIGPGRDQQTPQPVVSDAPKGSTIDIAGLPSEGSSSARVALVEFSDYQCPFCARFAEGVGKELKQNFVATGKVKHVFINNPLPMHSDAKLLATAAICAGDQGHYWEMHDGLFADKPRSESGVLSIAQRLKLDTETLQNCLKGNSKVTERINKDIATAKELKLLATPSFAVGQIDGQGKVSVTRFITGAQPKEVFEKVLEEALASTAF